MTSSIVDGLLAMTPSRPMGLKYESEFNWWRNCAANIVQWHTGQAASVWGYPCPDPPASEPNLAQAILSLRKAARHMYPQALQLPEIPVSQSYGRLLDLGCGPLCPATVFKADTVIGIDPLVFEYARIGYPIGLYNATCINIRTEDLFSIFAPLTFDTIISHNAIDHMGDFSEVASQIQLLARPGSFVRLNITYRKATITEPLEITDECVLKAFKSRPLTKIREQNMDDHKVVLWGTDSWSLH